MRQVLFLIFFLLISESAGTAKPVYRLGIAEVYPVAIQSGHANPGTPSTHFAFGIGENLNQKLVLSGDLAVVIPNTIFDPAPRLTASLGYRLGKPILSAGLYYQPTPPYNEKPLSHMFGMPITIGFPLNDQMSFSVGAGPNKLLHGPWSVSFVAKASVVLPI